MAKVLVSLKDDRICDMVSAALADTKHEVRLVEAFDPMAESMMAITDRIMAEKADVAVLDYWTEDAASVKLMQAVTDLAKRPEFIFIENAEEKAEREQILMAINEGARAFLPQNFHADALVNYVERAASGPGRLRSWGSGPQHNEKIAARLEESLGFLRVKNSSFKKLVAYLLATPVSAQARKVLVVSDSPYQLELLKKFLEEHNFIPLTAAHPNEGLAIALSERPKIVVSGMEFEGQTGIEFCQALKFTNKYVPCYFIICTSDKDKIAKVMVPGNGVDDCIVKPAGQSDQIDFVSRVALGLLV